MGATAGDAADVDVVVESLLKENRGDGLADGFGGGVVEADPVAGWAASADPPCPGAGIHRGGLDFIEMWLERDAVGLGKHVLECKGGFCGVACVAAVHEVSQLGHL